MSDVRHKLTWINATQAPLPLITTAFWPTGSEKADVMATLHRTAKLPISRASRANSPRPGATYAGPLIETQLRQALAEAEVLLHEKDLLIQAVLARRDSTANHLAGLTPRQRQVMELVLAGQSSKNIAADLGISQRTVENHRAAIMKRTGSTCLPALARMALAAAWDDAAAPPAGWRNTGGPGFASIGQVSADWCRGSDAGSAAPGRDAPNRSWSGDDGAVVCRRSPTPDGRQGASVTNFPTLARRLNKTE
jgi:DNA-binding CsgD family transcriptional regulator